jgi:sirohydrochlorin cobaltochelatase
MDAILLVGHGTRNEMGQRQFLKLAEHLRAAVSPLPLEVAFIELQPPTIEESLVRLYEHRLKNITLSPALLFAAGHAKHDIPAAVAAAQSRCADLHVKIAEPLGCHKAILELAAQRASLSSVLRGEGRGEGPALLIDSATTTLVLIGRGSSDRTASAHCRDFTAQLASHLQIKNHFTGFIAIAQPSLPEVLEQAAAKNPQQVIVQPHLLFTGEMWETTAAAVLGAQRIHPQIAWRQAETLGSDLLSVDPAAGQYLVRALLARLHAAP